MRILQLQQQQQQLLLAGILLTATAAFQTPGRVSCVSISQQRLLPSVSTAGGPSVSSCSSRRSSLTSLPARPFYDDDDDDNDDNNVDTNNSDMVKTPPLPLIKETSRLLKRASFFSWWAQVILTSVSAVILVFARQAGVTGRTSLADASSGSPPFVLSGCGILLSAASVIWTWGNTRLSRRLVRRPTGPFRAANLLRRAIRVGVCLNLAGLLLNLVAAEQIVGSLAVKVLTSRPFGTQSSILTSMEGLQPLDILVVQANTNSLLSHFCSLISLLYMTDFVRKLDPPSKDEIKKSK
jgi:hypothetical protein